MSDKTNAWGIFGFVRATRLLRGPRTGKVDCAVIVCVDLVDHVLQLGLTGVLPERSHDCS